jgi:hypothetical protein
METNILKRIFFDEHQHWEKFKSVMKRLRGRGDSPARRGKRAPEAEINRQGSEIETKKDRA